MDMPPIDFDYEPPPQNQPPTYSWSEVWTAVLTKPRVDTFDEILRDPGAKPARAYLWYYLTSLVAAVVSFGAIMNSPEFMEQLMAMNPEAASTVDSGTLFITVLCIAPFASIFALVGLLFLTYGMQFIANQINQPADATQKPQSRWRELVYMISAVSSPINVIAPIFVIVPILGILGLVLEVYKVYLMMLGVQSIYGFRNTQALMVAVIPEIILVLLTALFFF